MRSQFHLLLVLCTLLLLFCACDRPVCKNTNPLFDQYSPESQEYKAEMVKQLAIADKAELSYWFNQYAESNGQEQLYFNVQGDGLCAMLVLTVEEWGKLEEVRQKKGMSFQGAEFKNLQFDIKQDSAKTEFVYRDFDKIID